jgi:peptidoglycan L-alanyl-D-glutamate endopeptidase CwlK
MKVVHTNNGNCSKCAEFLKTAHPKLVAWFKKEQKSDPELHVSCSDRNRQAQEIAKDGGFSKASYGQSPHNYKPSWAIDLFFLIGGTAAWILSRYKLLAARKPVFIIWGADWNDNGRTDDEKFRDSPHFEYKGWKNLEKNYPNGTA